MSVADSIYGALLRFGRPMTLRRIVKDREGRREQVEVTVRGVSKGMKTSALIGDQREGDTVVTITNQEIVSDEWPGPPRVNDQIVVDGRPRTIYAVEPKYLGETILVFEMQVRG